MHVAARALISPNGTLYEDAVSQQPIFSSESSFAASNGWLNGGRGWLNGGMLIGTDGVFWPKLDFVNLYVSRVEQQLVSLQSDLLDLYTYSAPVPDYFSYWPDEFESLYSQANKLGIASSRLRRARRLAAWNAIQACRFIASEIRRAIIERIAHLRRRLRVAKALRSKLLRLAASVYKFRNQIVLQRRYYLAHGSHPIEDSTYRATRWSLDQRGCVPASL